MERWLSATQAERDLAAEAVKLAEKRVRAEERKDKRLAEKARLEEVRERSRANESPFLRRWKAAQAMRPQDPTPTRARSTPTPKPGRKPSRSARSAIQAAIEARKAKRATASAAKQKAP